MRAVFFFFQAEDGIRDYKVTGVQTCALPISSNMNGQSRSDVFLAEVPTTGGGGPPTQNVIWTNLVNVTATGNSIQKTGGFEGAEDAGATSQQQITSGDGYVEVTVGETNKTRSAGLCH